MAPPVFTLAQIVPQLQNQWEGTDEGTYRRWATTNVTYSLPFTSPAAASGEDAGFVNMTTKQQQFASEAFELWDDLIAINLNDSANNPSADITLAYSNTTVGDGTYTSPTLKPVGGNPLERNIDNERIWMDNNSATWPQLQDANIGYGERGFRHYIHEIGHALGLSHPGSYNAGPGVNITYDAYAEYTQDTNQYTIMSYFGAGADGSGAIRTAPPGASDVNNNGIDVSTPLLHDIFAIQSKYGADMTTRTGTDIYGFNASFSGGGYRGALDFTKNVNPVIAIWDAGGTDTLDVSGFTQNQRIDLNSGAFSDVGALTLNVAIAYNCVIENAVGGSGNDSITGNQAINVIEGRDGNDTLTGGTGFDYLYGGQGNDIYLLFDVTNGQYDFVNNIGGTDAVWVKHIAGGPTSYTLTFDIQNGALTDPSSNGFTLIGNASANQLFDDIGSNAINGMAGNDFIDGGAGNDTLEGGADSDTLQGNTGNDVYHLYDVSNGAYDTVVENAGQGVDAVHVRDVGSAVRSYTLTANVEVGAIVGAEADQFTLIGNNLDNTLYDDYGDNILNGGAGNDTLNGGGFYAGDSLIGGTGNDTYQLDFRRGDYDWVYEDVNGGTDKVEVTAFHEDDEHYTDAYTLTANVEIGEILGSIDFDLYGNAIANTLYGNSASNMLSGLGGNDKLAGYTGLDTLVGGEGDDKYYLEDLDREAQGFYQYDYVIEAAGGGVDTVYVTALYNPDFFSNSYALTANVENATVSGSLSFELDGNELANVLTGNSGANTLQGLEGNDSLNGGVGADYLVGGIGNDTYYIDNAGDTVVEGAGEGTTDWVATSISYTLAAGVQVELLSTTSSGATTAINLTGNSFAQVITGNAGANKLNGAGGADTMKGLGGNDTYYVDNAGDKVIEGAGQGTADWVAASTSYALSAGVQVEKLTTTSNGGTSAIDLTGNEFAQVITGNAGANRLNGGGGADTMTGFGGNDTYYVDNAGDKIAEGVGQGTADWVAASISYALAAGVQVEKLSTTNSGLTTAINLTGNEFVQAITGNAGANKIDGSGGADTMTGLGGNDTYYVDNVGDKIVEGANQGTMDWVATSVSYTLGTGVQVEKFSTTSSGATTSIDFTGNEFAQIITGNAGANRLIGMGGADTMTGLGGNDTYYIDNAADKVIEGAGQGTADWVAAAVSYVLGADVQAEKLSTTSSGLTTALNLTGNAFGQVVMGNAGANVLSGKAGNDTLTGRGGADVFVFDTGLNSTTNVDTITDYNVAADTIRLENNIFTQIVGTGTLTAAQFAANTSGHAQDASDRIIYETDTGKLFYDANGNATGGSFLFATLASGLALTNADFTVV